MPMALARHLPAEAPATPDAEEARRAAEEELSRPIYVDRKGILARIWEWIEKYLVGDSLGTQAPRWLSLLLVALLAAAIIAVLLLILRKLALPARAAQQDAPLFSDERDSTELARAADAAAAQGNYATAVVERFRAIIRSLDETGVIEEYPGMTALESVALTAQALGPTELVSRLGRAAELFDAVRYGKVASTPEQDEWMRTLAQDVLRAAPAPHMAPTTVGAAS